MDPCGKAAGLTRIGTLVLLDAPFVCRPWKHPRGAIPRPTGGDPVLDLMAYYDPARHTAIGIYHYATPGIATFLASSRAFSVWQVLCAGASCPPSPYRRTTRPRRSWSAICTTQPFPARATQVGQGAVVDLPAALDRCDGEDDYTVMEVHHIFPKALLCEAGQTEHKANALGNLCFLTAECNKSIGAACPAELSS